jgi:hypothetical protein
LLPLLVRIVRPFLLGMILLHLDFIHVCFAGHRNITDKSDIMLLVGVF